MGMPRAVNSPVIRPMNCSRLPALLWLIALAGAAALRAEPAEAKRKPSLSRRPAAIPAAAAVAPSRLVPQVGRASASYALAAETFDAGGASVLASAGGIYMCKDTSAGGIGALAASDAGAYAARGGYAGQLYEVQGLAVTSPSASVNEGASLPLGAAPLLDDGTLLAALSSSGVSWSVVSGPVASISPAGVATAATVYQNTSATVRATATTAGLTGTGRFTVLNVNTDDYGSYASDGIDDAWQVRYFGMNNPQAGPNVDADGTGQTNLFKYLADLNPLDPNSRFVLAISAVPGQPGARTLAFSPVYSGRTYTVQFTDSLTQANWTTLSNAPVSVSGTTETVTDPNATGSRRFYRVQVSMP